MKNRESSSQQNIHGFWKHLMAIPTRFSERMLSATLCWRTTVVFISTWMMCVVFVKPLKIPLTDWYRVATAVLTLYFLTQHGSAERSRLEFQTTLWALFLNITSSWRSSSLFKHTIGIGFCHILQWCTRLAHCSYLWYGKSTCPAPLAWTESVF